MATRMAIVGHSCSLPRDAGITAATSTTIAVTAAWSTVVGLGVTLLAIPVMDGLSRGKLAIANRLGSRALRADAIESTACGYLSAVVVVGLVAQLLLQAWWVECCD